MKGRPVGQLRKEKLGFLAVLAALVVACSGSPIPSQSAQTPRQPTPARPGQAPAAGGPSARPAPSAAIEYLDPTPMTRLISASPAPVRADREVLVPVITWGGDVATVYGNGGMTTQPNSVFAREGLSLRLFREDNFVKAVDRVVGGETPYLRGTLDMVVAALEALQDRGIDMVTIHQLTWSTGGDTIVMRGDAGTTAADLSGQDIGLQLFGPHMLYLATVLRDSGLDLQDVRIRWLRELTIPPYDTRGVANDPMTAMQRDANLAAVTVISPDMLALTSGGTVGTGAESSVKSAKMLLSTKTAGAVIADVYAVRRDYFEANRGQVLSFVQGLFKASEELATLVAARQARPAEYQDMLRISAEILRDSAQATADVEGLLQDCTFVGLQGNEQFFTGEGTLRSFGTLGNEAQSALLSYGLLTRSANLTAAGWNYAQLGSGLRQVAARPEPRFNPAQVEQLSRERELRGSTKEGVLFEFEIFFEPNQNDFPSNLYRREFDRVLNFASTYPGAVILIEGHADPLAYAQARQAGRPQSILEQTRQAAKNLSVQRALSVRENVLGLARNGQLLLDASQFTVVGAGIDRPKFSTPNNEAEWRANMRVAFQVVQVEAELQRFAGP